MHDFGTVAMVLLPWIDLMRMVRKASTNGTAALLHVFALFPLTSRPCVCIVSTDIKAIHMVKYCIKACLEEKCSLFYRTSIKFLI